MGIFDKFRQSSLSHLAGIHFTGNGNMVKEDFVFEREVFGIGEFSES